MQGKQFKLIYFSYGKSEVKQISLGWKTVIGATFSSFIILLGLTFFTLKAFTTFFHNTKISHFAKANSQLKDRLATMEGKVDYINKKVKALETDDNALRVFVDMPTVDGDTRKFGVGGLSEETFTSSLDEDVRERTSRVQQLINNLEQRIQFTSESREEILNKYRNDLNVLKRTPSIWPVIGGRVTDGFGYRMDPFLDKFKFHYGIDISAPRGTDVYATADGRVVDVIARYKPNSGYGKQITIDHGNGYRTHYAHLQKVLVKKGEWIRRYAVIGKVGDTGRSTAPHLHYEVLTHGKCVNPRNFILEDDKADDSAIAKLQ